MSDMTDETERFDQFDGDDSDVGGHRNDTLAAFGIDVHRIASVGLRRALIHAAQETRLALRGSAAEGQLGPASRLADALVDAADMLAASDFLRAASGEKLNTSSACGALLDQYRRERHNGFPTDTDHQVRALADALHAMSKLIERAASIFSDVVRMRDESASRAMYDFSRAATSARNFFDDRVPSDCCLACGAPLTSDEWHATANLFKHSARGFCRACAAKYTGICLRCGKETLVAPEPIDRGLDWAVGLCRECFWTESWSAAQTGALPPYPLLAE